MRNAYACVSQRSRGATAVVGWSRSAIYRRSLGSSSGGGPGAEEALFVVQVIVDGDHDGGGAGSKGKDTLGRKAVKGICRRGRGANDLA